MSEGQSIFDKAKDKAGELKDKAGDLVGRHEDKIDGAIDTAGDGFDKVTGGKFDDKVDTMQDKARDAVDNMSDDDDPDRNLPR
jgi:uncharacterized protein YjbJ (UPF0337 family)